MVVFPLKLSSKFSSIAYFAHLSACLLPIIPTWQGATARLNDPSHLIYQFRIVSSSMSKKCSMSVKTVKSPAVHFIRKSTKILLHSNALKTINKLFITKTLLITT